MPRGHAIVAARRALPYLPAVLARLILALLLAAFALPGAASACHDAPPAMVAMHHGDAMPGDSMPAKAMPVHACIGCIPPGDWLSARIAPRVILPAQVPSSVVATLDLGTAIPPALPPPRLV